MDGVPIRKLFVRNFSNRIGIPLRTTFELFVTNCRAMQDGSRKRIGNRDLRVMAADCRFQPGGMEQRLEYWNRDNMEEESSEESIKASESEPHSLKYLQHDAASVSIDDLNDDCLRHIILLLPIVDRIRIKIDGLCPLLHCSTTAFTVCKRWRDLSQDSWRITRTLDLTDSTWRLYTCSIPVPLFRKILLNCGSFLTQIILYDLDHYLSKSKLIRVYVSDMRTLAENCKNITKFSLGYCGESCDDDLTYFFEQNKNLEYLAISANYNFLGKSLSFLPEQTMHTIILNFCDNLQDRPLSTALMRLRNLKHLTINKCIAITGHILKTVGQYCKNLRALELGGIGSMDMSHLSHLVDLQILKITANPQVSDDFLAELARHCRQLTNLDITYCTEVTDAGLAAVATLVNLEKLKVGYMKRITDNGLRNMRGLKELECRSCFFTDRGMSTFIRFSPRLQFLDLYGCRNITDTTLEVAKRVCRNRTNNVILKMIVDETAIFTQGQEGLPPLLQIVRSPDETQ